MKFFATNPSTMLRTLINTNSLVEISAISGNFSLKNQGPAFCAKLTDRFF